MTLPQSTLVLAGPGPAVALATVAIALVTVLPALRRGPARNLWIAAIIRSALVPPFAALEWASRRRWV
jgi:hypothetical protein